MQHNPITWGGLQEHQTPRNDGISPTLTAAMGMGGGQTPIFAERSDSVGKVGQISSEGSQCGSVFSDEGNMATLTAGTHGDANPRIYTDFRIRKLTPRECWRLMGFTDSDFDKASGVNSNTQLYKQAGNSIVKHVLMAIFGQMIPGKEEIYKTYDSEQEEEILENEQNRALADCRDVVVANIIGMQNEMGCDTQNPKYQFLQELLEYITEKYGSMCNPFKG